MNRFSKTLNEKNGLWANIHAKRKRGEKPNPPGHPDRPTAQDFKDAQSTSKKEGYESKGKSVKELRKKKVEVTTDSKIKSDNSNNTETVVSEGPKSPGVGWMLKADPKLGAAVKAKRDINKKREASYGKPSAGVSVPRTPKNDYDRKVDSYLKKKYNEEVELDEAADKSSDVYKEYLGLKKSSLKELRDMIKLRRKVVDVSGYDKQGAISYLLRSRYGDKAVAAALGLKEEVEIDEAKTPSDSDLHKTLGSTKNMQQGVEALKKKHGMSDEQAKKHIRRLMGMKEEVEQIGELSKATLGSYVKKAKGEMGLSAMGAGSASARGDSKTKSGEMSHAKKRSTGIDKAVDKLTKEEVEQIDEISSKLAGDYYYKATQDQIKKKGIKGALADKTSKRAKGKDRAFDRIMKSEEVEQVDELSQNTLRQYHGKAALDIRKKKDQLNKGTLSTADHKQAQRRVTGINRAADKMESTDAYGKSLEKEKEKRLTPSDRDKLAKIRAMMSKEKK
jgi:hypothetical protein